MATEKVILKLMDLARCRTTQNGNFQLEHFLEKPKKVFSLTWKWFTCSQIVFIEFPVKYKWKTCIDEMEKSKYFLYRNRIDFELSFYNFTRCKKRKLEKNIQFQVRCLLCRLRPSTISPEPKRVISSDRQWIDPRLAVDLVIGRGAPLSTRQSG